MLQLNLIAGRLAQLSNQIIQSIMLLVKLEFPAENLLLKLCFKRF